MRPGDEERTKGPEDGQGKEGAGVVESVGEGLWNANWKK